jgi:hypothetical protein
VAFHATNLQSRTPPSGTPLVFNHVQYNEPGSYNSTTGYFTVPTAGLFYFIASTSANSRSAAHFYLYVDNTIIDYSYVSNQADAEMSSLHGVIHVQAGQRVWVKSGGEYWDAVSAFTGFLLSPDF